MCGDGANDCTALKTADVGLSLSDAEASIAAPFTSKTPDISSTIFLLRQGRASLDLSYSMFKYVMVMSATQFSSMAILHYTTCNLDDMQFGFINMTIIFPMLFMICTMDTSRVLSPELPFRSLLNKSMIISIIGHSLLMVIGQIIAYIIVRQEDYFEPVNKGHEFETEGYESTAVFLASTPQFMYIGIIYSIFTPFRQRLYKNLLFVLTVILMAAITYWVILAPLGFMKNELELQRLDFDFRLTLAGITVANGLANIGFESLLVYYFGYSEKREVNPA